MTNASEALRHFEDLLAGETAPLGPISFGREDIVAFASAWDPYPFHLDEAAAASSLLGGLAASGWHSTMKCFECLTKGCLSGAAYAGSLGASGLRWHRPVMVGDVLGGSARLDTLDEDGPRAGTGVARFAVEMRNQKEEPVLSAIFPILIYRRGTRP